MDIAVSGSESAIRFATGSTVPTVCPFKTERQTFHDPNFGGSQASYRSVPSVTIPSFVYFVPIQHKQAYSQISQTTKQLQQIPHLRSVKAAGPTLASR